MNGRGYLLTTAGFLALVIAFTTGSFLMLVSALSMLGIVVLALISGIATLLTIRIRVKTDRQAAERGDSVTLTAAVRHFSLIPPGNCEYSVEGGGSMDLPTLPCVKVTREYRIRLPHRGVYNLGRGRLSVTDIFDVVTLSRYLKAGDTMLTVYPKADMEIEARPVERDTGEMRQRLQDDAQEPASVRKWRDGDLMRRVHWKLTAKAYDPRLEDFAPVVKTYDEAARPDVLILPDFSRVQAVPARRLVIEDGICECALSAVRAYLPHTDSVLLITPQGEVHPDDAAQALAVAAFSGENGFERMAGEVMRRSARTGAAVFIKARLTYRDADALIRLSRATRADIILIWVTDSRVREAERLALRLEAGGVRVLRTDRINEQKR